MGPFCRLFFNLNKRSKADFTVGNICKASFVRYINLCWLGPLLGSDLFICNVGPCFQNCICQLNSGERSHRLLSGRIWDKNNTSTKLIMKGLFKKPFLFSSTLFPLFSLFALFPFGAALSVITFRYFGSLLLFVPIFCVIYFALILFLSFLPSLGVFCLVIFWLCKALTLDDLSDKFDCVICFVLFKWRYWKHFHFTSKNGCRKCSLFHYYYFFCRPLIKDWNMDTRKIEGKKSLEVQ